MDNKRVIRKKIGSPDGFLPFASTVFRKLVENAVAEAKRCSDPIALSYVLQSILQVLSCITPKEGAFYGKV